MSLNNLNALGLSPSFGCTASFSSLVDSVTYGDNLSQRSLKGINALSMSLSLNFNTLTDRESESLVNFLESQFNYEIQSYQSNGSFSNRRIEPFEYQPFYPYKKNTFNSLDFNHSQLNNNIHDVSVKLTSIAGSLLQSVESGPGHNPNIDATASIEIFDSNVQTNVEGNNVIIPSGAVIYNSGDYINATVYEDFIVNAGSSDFIKASSNFGFNSSKTSLMHTDVRNSIYIHNPNECSYYPYEPIHSEGNLKCRMFDFRPNQSIQFSKSPKYKKSSSSSEYIKYNKYGFNETLLNLKLNFSHLSDIEAKSILLFLESHLGYKKFGFHPAVNQIKDDGIHFFYSPEWDHEYVYKDNHNISATFIECINY